MTTFSSGENTLRDFSDGKIEELEKKIDGFTEKLAESGRKLLKMTDADVQFVHTDDATPYLLEKKASAKGIAKFERQRLMLFSDCIIFVAKKKVGLRNLVFKGRIFVHEMRLRNAPPGSENRECTLSYIRQTVDGTDTYTVMFATPSDKEEWWMGLDDVINGAKRDMQFGLKLHELMTINAREVGRDVPSILVKCIEFIDKHGLDTEGIYRISGSSVDIENSRAKFNKGLAVRFVPASDIHLVSGLLKLWLRDLREPLCTTGMFSSFIGTVGEEAEVHDKTIEMIAGLVVLLPQYERFALHELMLHLARVASHSAQNNMTPDNLAIVVGPNILKSPEMMSGNVHKTFARIFKVVELMIRHVDTVFVNVAEQRRALLEAAKDEAAREKAQFASVRKQTVATNDPADTNISTASTSTSPTPSQSSTSTLSISDGGTEGSDSDASARSSDKPMRTSPKRTLSPRSAPLERLVTQWRLTTGRAGMSTAEGEAVLRAVLTRAKATSTECDVLYTALRQLASLAPASSAPAVSSTTAAMARASAAPSITTTTSMRVPSVPIEDAAPAASEQPPRIVLGATRSQSQTVSHGSAIETPAALNSRTATSPLLPASRSAAATRMHRTRSGGNVAELRPDGADASALPRDWNVRAAGSPKLDSGSASPNLGGLMSLSRAPQRAPPALPPTSTSTSGTTPTTSTTTTLSTTSTTSGLGTMVPAPPTAAPPPAPPPPAEPRVGPAMPPEPTDPMPLLSAKPPVLVEDDEEDEDEDDNADRKSSRRAPVSSRDFVLQNETKALNRSSIGSASGDEDEADTTVLKTSGGGSRVSSNSPPASQRVPPPLPAEQEAPPPPPVKSSLERSESSGPTKESSEKKMCEQCKERKAKHRVTLKSGRARLLCVECVKK